jgi:RimJ/RimL family protein N-acetyltransferase
MANDTTPIINISGERVGLGPLRRELIPLYHQWRNDQSTSQTIGLTWPVTLDDETRRYDERSVDPGSVWFTIYEMNTLTPVGLSWLYDIDNRHSRASFGISIGHPDNRGRGLGTDATRLTLDYAFNSLGLENVMLTVLSFNAAGVRAYENAGFRTFGVRHRCSRVGGQLHDLVHMECLASDFSRPHPL